MRDGMPASEAMQNLRPARFVRAPDGAELLSFDCAREVCFVGSCVERVTFIDTVE